MQRARFAQRRAGGGRRPLPPCPPAPPQGLSTQGWRAVHPAEAASRGRVEALPSPQAGGAPAGPLEAHVPPRERPPLISGSCVPAASSATARPALPPSRGRGERCATGAAGQRRRVSARAASPAPSNSAAPHIRPASSAVPSTREGSRVRQGRPPTSPQRAAGPTRRALGAALPGTCSPLRRSPARPPALRPMQCPRAGKLPRGAYLGTAPAAGRRRRRGRGGGAGARPAAASPRSAAQPLAHWPGPRGLRGAAPWLPRLAGRTDGWVGGWLGGWRDGGSAGPGGAEPGRAARRRGTAGEPAAGRKVCEVCAGRPGAEASAGGRAPLCILMDGSPARPSAPPPLAASGAGGREGGGGEGRARFGWAAPQPRPRPDSRRDSRPAEWAPQARSLQGWPAAGARVKKRPKRAPAGMRRRGTALPESPLLGGGGAPVTWDCSSPGRAGATYF